eukprot:gnl/TRDRNA2_/TRDRNA2_170198_c2_seq2.p1 gnl/TRDRNA2_/TRDRNA2_170198_c2~~gnl/TRDRNA2_/TRDRNA2_170198_c2_seq2.p1  ORF type:complete len:360 (+),score=61.72 gnl/TRDRNA2_/TRDRNA2_170198_c2_seq2:94-1080(+)
MSVAGLWDPVKIPEGLTCKNTFFDIPSMDDPVVGPASCPLPTKNWWASEASSPRASSPLRVCSELDPTPDWFDKYLPQTGNGRHFDQLLADAMCDSVDEPENITLRTPPRLLLLEHLSNEPKGLPMSSFEPVKWGSTPLPGLGSEGRILLQLARVLHLPPPGTDKKSQLRMPASDGMTASKALPPAVASPGTSAPTANDSSDAAKAKRRRGSKQAKEPDRDPVFWLPTATYVDLGCLVRVKARSGGVSELGQPPTTPESDTDNEQHHPALDDQDATNTQGAPKDEELIEKMNKQLPVQVEEPRRKIAEAYKSDSSSSSKSGRSIRISL